MNTVHLTDAEFAIVRHALQAYLRSFGHDEADIVATIKQALAKLAEASHDEPRELIG